MIRYRESLSQSAELLRQVLARLGQHDAACNPITFAVWYEHVAGMNPRLSKDIEQCLADEPRLGDETMQRLHRDHIAQINEAAAERASEGFRRVMQDLADSAARTGDSANAFGEKLSVLNSALKTADGSALSAQVDDALASTVQMRSSVQTLQEQVETSRNEIVQLRDALQRTREEALLCPLTHVLNRKGFDQRLAALLAPVDGATGQGCLVMIDIDHFKLVNDTHGHLIGDRVLQSLGEILRRTVTAPGSSTARYGGEEFAILLAGSSLDQAVTTAEALRANVKLMKLRQRNTDKVLLTITVSAGVAMMQSGDDASALIARADAALYRSKREGRDRVTVG